MPSLGSHQFGDRTTSNSLTDVDASGHGPGHLIHVGYPKAGSTFLQSWFANHPEIAYEPSGIAGYRTIWEMVDATTADGDAIRWHVTSAEALVAPPERRADGLVGEVVAPADPRRRAAACARLGMLFPTAHVLMVTRGFRSIIGSAYSQYVREGGVLSLDALAKATDPDQLTNEWDYDHAVTLYRKTFGDRLHVLPFELLRDDPSEFVSVLQNRLALTVHAQLPTRLNPALSQAELAWYPRLSTVLRGAPLPGRLRARAQRAYLRRTRAGGFPRLARMLQTLRPLEPVDVQAASAAVVDAFRGRAEALRDEPSYGPYLADYLLD